MVHAVGSGLFTHNRTAIPAEINNFSRFGIFRWFEANVQEHALATESSFKSQFRRGDVLASGDSHKFRLEVGQKFQNVTQGQTEGNRASKHRFSSSKTLVYHRMPDLKCVFGPKHAR